MPNSNNINSAFVINEDFCLQYGLGLVLVVALYKLGLPSGFLSKYYTVLRLPSSFHSEYYTGLGLPSHFLSEYCTSLRLSSI